MNQKDGRFTAGSKRLGRISAKMAERIAAYATHRDIGLNDATIELLDFALLDFEELADAPPAVTDLFEVEP